MPEGSVVGEGREECGGQGHGGREGDEEKGEEEDSHFVAGGRVLLLQSPAGGLECRVQGRRVCCKGRTLG